MRTGNTLRVWHILSGVLLTGVGLSLVRDPVGRVSLIVFVTGLGEVIFGTTALLALFETLGALGDAKDLPAHAEAVVATTGVLLLAAAIMTAWFWVGAWLVQASVA